jgi:hypothetical protein
MRVDCETQVNRRKESGEFAERHEEGVIARF